MDFEHDAIVPMPLAQTQTQTSNSIRSKLNDQLTKLQVKHNAEVEFLEDMRSVGGEGGREGGREEKSCVRC